MYFAELPIRAMYVNTANMVETRFAPESYEFEFMPLVTSCGSQLPRWPFIDPGLLVLIPCVGHFPTVGVTSRIQQKWCCDTSKNGYERHCSFLFCLLDHFLWGGCRHVVRKGWPGW